MHRNQRSSSSSLCGNPRLLSVVASALGLALVAAAFAACGGSPRQAAKSAPQAEEKGYLQNIQVTPGRVEAAQNFLKHTVTTVRGTVTNNGSKTVRYLEISLTFSDIEGKPIEQKTAAPISGSTPLLKPGETRPFELSFDQVPAMWNQAVPRMAPVRVVLGGQ